MAIFSTENLRPVLPSNIVNELTEATRNRSVVAQLSNSEPQNFGKTDIIHFTEKPKAEYVGEGAPKSASKAAIGSVTVTPKKFQTTMRFSEEVLWADEDYQLGVIAAVANVAAQSIADALDYGIFHGVDPLSGKIVAGLGDPISSTTNTVDVTSGEADAVLNAAIGSLMSAGKNVDGVAMSNSLAYDLTALTTQDGTPRYPAMGFDINNYRGINVVKGNSVEADGVEVPTGIKAIVGDFQNGIRWGIQRELPLEVIRYGDPNGEGDLKRKNEIAIRLETVYGWYTFNDRFAVVKTAAA